MGSKHSWGRTQGFELVIISGIHLRGIGWDGRRCVTVKNLVKFSEIEGRLGSHGRMGEAIKNLVKFFKSVGATEYIVGGSQKGTSGTMSDTETKPKTTRHQRPVSRMETEPLTAQTESRVVTTRPRADGLVVLEDV